jgi:Spy/CpxP family protein refolding chaperone
MTGKSMWTVLAAAGVLSGVALAQPPDGKPRGRAFGRAGRFAAMADFVGLSAEQREQLASLRAEHQKETAPLREEGRKLHESLRAALDPKNPDPRTVGTAMIAVKAHREKMKATQDAFRDRMKAQLTPEQQQKWEAFEAARGAGRGRRGGRGFDGPGFFAEPDGPPPTDSDLDGPPSF